MYPKNNLLKIRKVKYPSQSFSCFSPSQKDLKGENAADLKKLLFVLCIFIYLFIYLKFVHDPLNSISDPEQLY